MGPVMAIGIAAFGRRIVSTNIYAYLADCYTSLLAVHGNIPGSGSITPARMMIG
jgi:hypothetical protein